ncbi:hypothetical protein [Candidatus Cyanaurora vandensis]|uniref:hypothetical protein n=1 Tax=Candidatus Cyanaurora vandensis TaxID=2714958 RepID=UPI00258091D9|nr:hypothetical protein [Candidatus Cyanaurora vandensis]
MTKDRRRQLLTSTTRNGLDFVEILSLDQRTLRLHFLNPVAVSGTVTQIIITGGETIPEIQPLPMQAGDWATDWAGRPLLTLTVLEPGDFSRYTLTVVSPVLDPFFHHVEFSFKALCPSDLDCDTPSEPCPLPVDDPPPIDYLAKDFLSFREALLAFSALRYPEWRERTEADFGVMFLEALSALGDDLSYYQDRIGAEASLDTATQRRSLVRHARLVDYEPRPATAARVLLQFDVQSTTLPSGLAVYAQGPTGEMVNFETGTSLVDPATGLLNPETFPVNPRWNRNPGLVPYYWDDAERCLTKGSTTMWVLGHGYPFYPGQTLLIETAALVAADPPRRELVVLTQTLETVDELFLSPAPDPSDPDQPTPVTQLFWGTALTLDHDLTQTLVSGNLLPATQGGRRVLQFTIPPAATNPAWVRTGANSTPDLPVAQYLFTLPQSPLVWLDPAAPGSPLPEILLSSGQPWLWRRTLLQAGPQELAFTLDPMVYTPVARFANGTVFQDYDSDQGYTLRFGEGSFGQRPDPGTVFDLTYRVGGGPQGNVAAETIQQVDPQDAATYQIRAVTNPFAAQGGKEAETEEQVRRLAPQAFRARQFRAVRLEDYQQAAQTLAWVQRAGTVYRWTGSWLTVFTTPDPRDSQALALDQHRELIDLLNRYRLAGYESYVPQPRYLSLDLEILVCARPEAFRGDVLAELGEVLSSQAGGFFHVDRFTFGQPLERSALAAAIQQAYGVAGVVRLRYRQRGVMTWQALPETVPVAPDTILRLDNDPSRPERGTLRIIVEGGK